jgi:hypothetical protein
MEILWFYESFGSNWRLRDGDFEVDQKSDSIFGSRDDAGTQEKIEGSSEIMSEPRGTAETPQLQDLGSKLDSSHTIDSNSISIEADPKIHSKWRANSSLEATLRCMDTALLNERFTPNID